MTVREQFACLDSVNLNLGSGTGLIMSLVLALIMFGIALELKPGVLKNVFLHPRSILTGVALQWIFLPMITFLLIMCFNKFLTPMVCLGMLLVASCPGGNISNFMSYFSKGNAELSVSMTAVSTCGAPFVTPLNFWFWGNMYLQFAGRSADITIPHLVIPFWSVFSTVFLILGIPILLGLLVSRKFPNFTKKVRKPFSIFSMAVFIVMVLGMFIPNWQLFINYIGCIFVLVLIHNACAFGLGYGGATLMKLPPRDKRSITIEVGIQNSGLGLTMLLNPAIFPPEVWNNPQTGIMYGGMLFVTAWWGIWHIVSGISLTMLFRSHKLPEVDD